MEEASECLKTLEGELKDKKFFGGEKVGMVDIVASLMAFWIRILQEIVGVDLLTPEKFPVLFKWSEELVGCPIIKENLPPRDQLITAFRARLESSK